MLHTCHIRVTYVSHTCYIRVTYVSHTCHIRVTYVSHTCHIRVTYVSHTCHIRVTVRDGGPGSSERSSFASSFITTSMSVTDLTIRIDSIHRRPHGLTISASTQAATTWKILDISTPNMHHTPPQRMLIGCHTMSYYVILCHIARNARVILVHSPIHSLSAVFTCICISMHK